MTDNQFDGGDQGQPKSLGILIGQLLARGDETQRQLGKIEGTLARIADHHDLVIARVAILEIHNAEQTGGTRMLLLLSGAAATLGGIAATIIGKVWP